MQICAKLHSWINDPLGASLTAKYHSAKMNKQCWNSQQQKPHPMMTTWRISWMTAYFRIFCQLRTSSLLVWLRSAMWKEMWQSKGTRQSEQPLQQHRIELLYRCKFSPRAGSGLRVTAGVLLLLHWIPLKKSVFCWTLKLMPKTKQNKPKDLKLRPKKSCFAKVVYWKWLISRNVFLNCGV